MTNTAIKEIEGQSAYTGNEDSEIYRIHRQNEYLNKIAEKHLNGIFSRYQTPVVLDVGCSEGSNILLRLKGRKYHALLGIDRNSQKISIANELYKSTQNTFLFCDVNTGKLEEVLQGYLRKIEKPGFDIIHIASVLLHIENPQELLQRLRLYLTEKGTVFIQDEDDGFNIVYPYNKSFEDCFYVWNHSNEAGDRYMGRKIPYLLTAGGYSDINILSSTISSFDFNSEMKECLWDMYFNCELWVANDASYYDNDEAYERFLAYRENHSLLKKDFMNGKYFIELGIFFITATK